MHKFILAGQNQWRLGIDRWAGIPLVVLACLCLIAFPVGATPEADGPEKPREVVESFHAALLGVMKQAASLKVKERFARLAPSIEQSFDLAFMIRIAASSHWQGAEEKQRAALIAAFRRLSIAVYASRFDGYSGQSFKTLKVGPGPRKTILVKTNLVRPKDKPIELVYVMKRQKGKWRIIDIVLDGGISELAVRFSEYRQTLKKSGVKGLVDLLDGKSRQLIDK